MEPEEVPRLEKLFERGVENGVKDLKMVGPEGIKEIEPNCVVRVSAFLCYTICKSPMHVS